MREYLDEAERVYVDDLAGGDAGPEALLEPETGNDSEKQLEIEDSVGELVPFEPGPLSSFFDALEEMENAKSGLVRVLHYGDSHTAADFLTTAIRRSLQERFGDGGRGFVLLGEPWRAYSPKDVTVASFGDWDMERVLIAADPVTLDGRYGLGGICAESGTANTRTVVSTSTGTDFGQKASSFEVFYLKQQRGGSFDIFVDGEEKASVSTRSRQIESGFYEVDVEEGAHRFEVRINGDGMVRLFGAVVEDDGPGVVYDTLGVNGGFFHTPLRWDAELLAEQIRKRDPRLVILMYGANEVDSRTITPSSYEHQVKKVVPRFLVGAPDASCLILGPTDRRVERFLDDGTDQLTWIIDVQRNVASELGCAFLDLRQMMGGAGSHEEWSRMSPPLAQPDGVHLTVKGYRVLGEKIAEHILSAYELRDEERAGGIRRASPMEESDEL